jgi:hydrogenase expression/formation protein HypD
MKYLDGYRDDRVAGKILDEIRRTVTRHWVLMEVCGGQTHSIVKYGLDYLLPPEIELVHGPGCLRRHVPKSSAVEPDRPAPESCRPGGLPERANPPE